MVLTGCQGIPLILKIMQKDPLCSFMFTVNAYYQMFCGIQEVNRQEKNWEDTKDTSYIFWVRLENDDPVGNFGKSVENIYKDYKSCGIEDVSIKLYENDRHEILNEVDRSLVFDDLLTWMEKSKKIDKKWGCRLMPIF